MSREIKFRAWNEEQKQMALVSSLHSSMNIHVSYQKGEEKKGYFFGGNWVGADWNKDNAILMQFTGSKDKNGVEIYEGDILRHNKYRTTKDVEWVDGCGFQCYIDCDDEFDDLMGYIPKMIEVIGNIHENKDLT
jgi:uncharacterized phage protein (TIGR01671 family)